MLTCIGTSQIMQIGWHYYCPSSNLQTPLHLPVHLSPVIPGVYTHSRADMNAEFQLSHISCTLLRFIQTLRVALETLPRNITLIARQYH